jgi:Pvc16 N-terminal domain
MPDYGVIADVSATLTATLTDALSTLMPAPPPIAHVHDLLGTIATDPPMLTVFLYEVAEDPTAKNRPERRETAPPNVVVRRAPLALVLRYLITPWSNDRLTDQRILGRSMQALHDNAIITGPELRGGLIGSAEALKIGLNQLSLEERTRIWHAIQQPYRISASYDVRVVSIESTVDRLVTPVARRDLEWSLS